MAENKPLPNAALELIWDELHPLFAQSSPTEMDPFCLYLLGIAARRLGRLAFAREALANSVRVFPYNWSAWLELGKSISSQSEVGAAACG